MSWMRFSAWYLVSDLWVVFIALSLFVAWWEGHLGFKNLLRSCLFGDATQLGISVEMGHVSSQLNFTASLLALRLYSRWPLYVLMCASICLQGIYVSKPIYNCIVHLHEFVCSGVWCVVNYCRGFSWCYLAGKYRMNGWTFSYCPLISCCRMEQKLWILICIISPYIFVRQQFSELFSILPLF